MCVVRIVLLCKGRGGEASSYRPNRHDTQWTNRRDALVRCVAAFLYGPSSSSAEREVILIHDEDYARIEMRLQPNIVPTEQAILSLWKEAATNPGRSINVEKGITCRMVLLDKSSSTTADACMPTNMDSKRQVLEYLQQHCSMEFLRKHRLNSSVDVILRKTNKKALMEVYREWNNKNASSTMIATTNKQERLASIFQELLKPINTLIEQVVAGILHESSAAELPCFDVESEETPNLQICLFLGAVRDMHPWENRVLSSCCLAATVPLVRVRLSPVSEFTSKILSVVATHDAHETLGPALLRLCDKQVTQKALVGSKHENAPTRATQRLHVVCFMPIPSDALSSDLNQRSRALWALVRVTVCTLWRSRLASSSVASASPLQNELTILFEDGVVITLKQDELVTSLAEQHQAAPCEYQILQALCKKRDETVASSNHGDWNAKRADELLQSILSEDQSSLPTFALDTTEEEDTGKGGLVTSVYSSVSNTVAINGGQLVLLLRIRDDGVGVTNSTELTMQVKEACERRCIPVLRESLVTQVVQDKEAATVTMIQHFIYQGRLFPALEDVKSKQREHLPSDKKRRRKKDKKARKERKKKKRKRSE